MKKRLFSLALALVLCMGLTVPVSAAGLEDSYETFFGDHNESILGKTTPGGRVSDVFTGHMGLKDKAGNIVIQPKYLTLSMKGDVLIAVKQVGDFYAAGIIDIHENILAPFKYYQISVISYGANPPKYWEVIDSDTFLSGILGPDYSVIVPTMYSGVSVLSEDDGYFRVTDTHNEYRKNADSSFAIGRSFMDNKWGVCNRSGKLIIPCEYDDISYLGDGFFSVRKNELLGVLNSQGGVVLPLEYAAPYNYSNISRYQNAFIVDKYVSAEYQKRRAAGESCPDVGELWTTSGVVDANNNILIGFGKYQTIRADSTGTFACGKWTGGYVNAQYQVVGAATRRANEYEYDYFRYDDLKATAPAQPAAPASPASPASPTKFTDVSPTSPFVDAINWAVEKNITGGKTATTFAPGEECTRGQILTFLWRANGSPEPTIDNPFTDSIPASFQKAAVWAYEKGLVSGAAFGSATPCTRAVAVEYLWKATGSPTASGSASFADVPANANYAQAVAWAVANGVTGGTGNGQFSPDNTCTRGQIVTFLYRAMGK